jgi:hypothetical protein
MLVAANLLQACAFLGLAYCLTVLFLHIFPTDFALALIASVLSEVGVVVLTTFDMVGADYPHLFLAVLFILLTGIYIETASRRIFIALVVIGALTTLTRYLGAAVLVMGVLAILWLGKARFGERLRRAFLLSLSAVPAGLWLAITSQMYGRRDAISFQENFTWFSRSILEWFFTPRAVRHDLGSHIAWLWIIVGALILVLVALSGRRTAHEEPEPSAQTPWKGAPGSFLIPFLLYGLCYTLALFGSASIAYFNKLGGRFLLPLYVPLLILPVAAIDVLLRRARQVNSRPLLLVTGAVSYGVLLGIALLLLRITLPLAIQSHTTGAAGGENVYNTRTWRENPAVQYWLDHVPSGRYVLFSNDPDGAAFLTQHAVGAAPRRTSGPYGTDQYPLKDYRAELFSAGDDAYLLWIEPNPYPFYYSVGELRTIAEIDPLLVSNQGGVYRLRPRRGT